jgi:N-acetyl-alpha-D-muramate 1-phosphate uridylyltransferase
MIPVVILAGGLATRLRPITENIPKSLVEIAGEPFIVHQLRELNRQGIKDVVLCVGHLGKEIEAFVKDGSEYGVRVQYSYETPKLLGTGGAIRNALSLLNEAFFVLYGDSWLEIDYRTVSDTFQNSENSALMTVFRNEGRWDTSNVEMDGDRIKLYSKDQPNPRMTHIDYGLGILKSEVFENYSHRKFRPGNSKFDLAEIYEELSKKRDLASFEATHRFYEIGSHDGLKELNGILGVRD